MPIRTERAVVRIELSGSRWEDARRALAAVRSKAGDPEWTKPRGWIYHHSDDQGTIQVVPVELHGGLPHTGGFATSRQDLGLPHRKVGAAPTPLRDSDPPVSAATLKRIEDILEVRLPPEFTRFIKQWNGGRPRVNGFRTEAGTDEALDRFLGFGGTQPDDMLTVLSEYSDRFPEGLFPIAYDAFGNIILLGLDPAHPGVWFWDHELESESSSEDLENTFRVAPTFGAFLGAFFEE